MNLKERTYLWYLAALRIYIGFYVLAIFVLASPGRTVGLDGLLFATTKGKGA